MDPLQILYLRAESDGMGRSRCYLGMQLPWSLNMNIHLNMGHFR